MKHEILCLKDDVLYKQHIT